MTTTDKDRAMDKSDSEIQDLAEKYLSGQIDALSTMDIRDVALALREKNVELNTVEECDRFEAAYQRAYEQMLNHLILP